MVEFLRSNQIKNIKSKNLHMFTVFDIQELYPSIGRKRLKEAVLFAQTHTDINQKDIEVIFHCHRSLFHDNKPWIKKDRNGDLITLWEVKTEQRCV